MCDCCYSGSWVVKLDEKGISACGHEAKKVGYFLKIISSGLKNEVADDRLYSKASGVSSAEDWLDSVLQQQVFVGSSVYDGT